ncbi:MAG: HEAT repeat domain-containing protein [Candidatus Aminicenantes bacterium]|nr:HEAT repeat domain-containing protein [Candidatus Aminicenantes bacterium]
MKTVKMIAVLLALGVLFSSFASAQTQAEKAKEAYEKAKIAIVIKDWKAAVEAFQKLELQYNKSDYYGEALYWLGYSLDKYSDSLDNAQNQLEKKKEAIARLNLLLEKLPENAWAQDAKMLRLQIAEKLAQSGLNEYSRYINNALELNLEALQDLKKNAGEAPKKPIDPETELKLVALDALLQMDKEKAFPILEKMLREQQKPELKEKALFVLSQSKDPKVVPILAELATKDASPKIRQMAVFWLGQRHDEESLGTLVKVYDTSEDMKVKENLIMAFGQSKSAKAQAKIMDIAKNDKDIKARERAVFWLAQKKSDEIMPLLLDIYSKTDNASLKQQVIFSLSQNKSPKAVQTMIELARKEKDLAVKKQIIFWLGQSKSEEAMKFLKEIIEK